MNIELGIAPIHNRIVIILLHPLKKWMPRLFSDIMNWYLENKIAWRATFCKTRFTCISPFVAITSQSLWAL